MASVCSSICFWMPGSELGEANRPKAGVPMDTYNEHYEGGDGSTGGNYSFPPTGGYGLPPPSNINNRGSNNYNPGGGGGGYQPGLY